MRRGFELKIAIALGYGYGADMRAMRKQRWKSDNTRWRQNESNRKLDDNN